MFLYILGWNIGLFDLRYVCGSICFFSSFSNNFFLLLMPIRDDCFL